MQVEPNGALAIDILGDERIITVFDVGPVLLRAHPEDLRHCGYQASHLLNRRHNDHRLHFLRVYLRAAGLLISLSESLEEFRQVLLEDLIVHAVIPPPELAAVARCTHASPIEDAAVQLALAIAPEVRVVHVQVHVAQRGDVWVHVHPVVDLSTVCVDGHHHLLELLQELLTLSVLREEHLPGIGDEGTGHFQFRCDLLGSLARATAWVHAPHHRIARVSGRPEACSQQFWRAHLSSLGETRHLRAHPGHEHVVLLVLTPEVVVDALVIGALDRPSRQWFRGTRFRLSKIVAIEIMEIDALCDDNPIRCLVADISEIKPRSLHGKNMLQIAVSIDLVQLRWLLVHRTANTVILGHPLESERDLGEELRVEIRRRLLPLNLEQKLPTIVASRHLDFLLKNDLRHFVVLRDGTRFMHCLGQPLGTELSEGLFVPWEFHAVHDPRRLLHVVVGNEVGGNPLPLVGRLR
mmetsp:Transcript_15586/g.33075  ORF Transcript_15586/g.33075 Transcript_15586/m.33075 type:complete len:465 (+) Transcript_15586:293-1687(+)